MNDIDLGDLADDTTAHSSRMWYFVEGKAVERPSWTASLDVLGFKRLVINARLESRENEELQRYSHAIREALRRLRFDNYPWFLKTYSDNVLLASPIVQDGEMNWWCVTQAVAAFQASMALSGYFVRGGLACGGLHVSREFVYGESLIEAHETEETSADWPRVMLSTSAMAIVADHIAYSNGVDPGLHGSEVLQDAATGRWFLDYIRLAFVDERNTPRQGLERHRDIVESAARLFPDGRIGRKYRRLASYHNLICEEQGWRDLRCRLGRLPAPPRRLTTKAWKRFYKVVRQERRRQGLPETPFDKVIIRKMRSTTSR